jgi:hypothetical protein
MGSNEERFQVMVWRNSGRLEFIDFVVRPADPLQPAAATDGVAGEGKERVATGRLHQPQVSDPTVNCGSANGQEEK